MVSAKRFKKVIFSNFSGENNAVTNGITDAIPNTSKNDKIIKINIIEINFFFSFLLSKYNKFLIYLIFISLDFTFIKFILALSKILFRKIFFCKSYKIIIFFS